MSTPDSIQIFEHDWLQVDKVYNGVKFKPQHFELLAKYATANPKCSYYTLYHNRIRFLQYVGVIKVGNLTIEVLPKVDRSTEDKSVWRDVLLQMLAISLQVAAKTTTPADMHVKHMSVLETYLHLFVQEAEKIIHQGLVKKYRTQDGNQTSLKGKVLISRQIQMNLVHAERFLVAYPVYDGNNIFNSILFQTIDCVKGVTSSENLKKQCESLQLSFPECRRKNVSEQLFSHLVFDRKTERYRYAMLLSRIILLNYHPDLRTGSNHILAIMFDMNLLWETYIYSILKKAQRVSSIDCKVLPQQRALFWQNPSRGNLRLKPDLLLECGERKIVLDTKWKYESTTSVEDVRQMYAYKHFFNAHENFLVYPKRLLQKEVELLDGKYYLPQSTELSDAKCGLMFVDLLNKSDGSLNKVVGAKIFKSLGLIVAQTEPA